MTEQADLIEVVSRRHDVLRSLLEDPAERHVLVDRVAASKSTVYRGVSQLRERGLLTQTEAGLEPTQFGITALARYDELAGTAAMEPLLADLPAGTIDPAALIGAETVVPDNIDVERHHDRLETLLEEATAIRGFSPAVAPAYLRTIPRRVREDALTVEFVLTDELVAHAEEEYPSALAVARSTEDVALYRTDAELPLTVLLVESSAGTTVCVELGEDDGPATGLLVNDTVASRRWAESVFERRRRAAAPITTGSQQSP